MKGFIVSSVAVAVLVVIVFLMSGCIDGNGGNGEGTALDFETIEKGYYHQYYNTTQEVVIDDISTYGILYNMMKCGYYACGIVVIPPEVDFSNSTVIAVFMGEKPTGGHDIEITNITDEGDKVVVNVKRISPDENCVVTQVLTQPYHIVKTSKITKNVEFIYEDEITQCD